MDRVKALVLLDGAGGSTIFKEDAASWLQKVDLVNEYHISHPRPQKLPSAYFLTLGKLLAVVVI